MLILQSVRMEEYLITLMSNGNWPFHSSTKYFFKKIMLGLTHSLRKNKGLRRNDVNTLFMRKSCISVFIQKLFTNAFPAPIYNDNLTENILQHFAIR